MALRITGLKRRSSVAKAMAAVFPARAHGILRFEAAVRADDVEGVHQMRVATKRLREAARLFRPAFGRRRLAAHIEHLQALNNALGHVRELDVIGLQLEELAGRMGEAGCGLAPLIEDTARQRKVANDALLPVLESALPFVERDFAELLRERTRKRREIWRMPFMHLACQAIARRVQRVFELEPAARRADAVGDFHIMRIAVKKAKYALELSLGILEKRARKAYKPVAELQELMGLVHDCDVLLAVLAGARGRLITDEAHEEASALIAADRTRLHAQTMALLDKMQQKRLKRRLLKALRCGSGGSDR